MGIYKWPIKIRKGPVVPVLVVTASRIIGRLNAGGNLVGKEINMEIKEILLISKPQIHYNSLTRPPKVPCSGMGPG